MMMKFHDFLCYGVSSDEKPTWCDNGCVFIETDTDNVYIWSKVEMAWIRIESSRSIITRETEILEKATQLVYEYSLRENSMIASPERSSLTCIACGTPLDAVTRGRHKFCAKCGVYLPRIIYDKSA